MKWVKFVSLKNNNIEQVMRKLAQKTLSERENILGGRCEMDTS
jgi:hypothetical protein